MRWRPNGSGKEKLEGDLMIRTVDEAFVWQRSKLRNVVPVAPRILPEASGPSCGQDVPESRSWSRSHRFPARASVGPFRDHDSIRASDKLPVGRIALVL